jgi:hypothetical protein
MPKDAWQDRDVVRQVTGAFADDIQRIHTGRQIDCQNLHIRQINTSNALERDNNEMVSPK